jgi:predicted ATPase/class 3 adenylate cyclase
MGEPPSGTVTFLFTDIEGSTQLWERYPAAMRAAQARHEALLRAAIEEHGGYIFKTVGDAFCAAFATAAQGLNAILTAQRALAAELWGETGPIKVRAALHTGAVESRSGDYFGHTLSRVARILSAGYGGQTLFSATSAPLVRDSLPADVALRDLGSHRLKSLTYPEQIFQLVAADLPAEFPPLKTLDARPTNLPSQPTMLIGREREVAVVCETLRRADVRLLTLTGPGGTGKTRLALQVAAELLDDFRDGVFFVALAPISDPGLVATTIARVLGVKEAEGRSLMDRLKEYLPEKELLLLLDNFEQVADAAPLLGELLAVAPKIKLLVTSRVVLHLYGEREFAVPPLALPDLKRLPSIERLTQYDAVRLFIERAQAVKADFSITNENAPAVAEICYRLDGLPLAIELAAARVKLFPPQALLARLGGRLKLLTGGARDLPLRQQTIRNTIDWSYHLLDEGEKTLFAQLGVFVGGFTIEAAEAVASELKIENAELRNASHDQSVLNSQFSILNLIEALVDNSLLKQVEGIDGEPRFTMLETLREYAWERLVACGEADEIQRRHAGFFLSLAEQAESQFFSQHQRMAITRLAGEYENLRAVLEWSLESIPAEDVELGARLAGALWRFWWMQARFAEGRLWLEAVLRRCDALLDTQPTTHNQPSFIRLRAQLLTGLGGIARGQLDTAAARKFLEEGLNLWQALADKIGIATVLNILGNLAYDQNDYTTAQARYEESLAFRRELGDTYGSALVLNNLGNVADGLKDYAKAQALQAESLSLMRELGNTRGIAYALFSLGALAFQQGDLDAAGLRYEESLSLMRQIEDRRGIGGVVLSLGFMAQHQGDTSQAMARFHLGLALGQELGIKDQIANCLVGLAGVAAANGKSERATRLLGASKALLDAIGVTFEPITQAEYDRSVVMTGTHLDEVTFAAAWVAGQALTLEQAIVEASDVGE